MDQTDQPENQTIIKSQEESQLQKEEEEEEDDDTLCPFFKSLVINQNTEDRDEALLTFQIFVAKNKPSYKLLEDEMMLLIRKYLPQIQEIEENPLNFLVRRLLELYEAARKKGMNPLTLKIFLRTNSRLKFEFPENFNEEIKEIALSFWTKIDGANLNTFLTIFEIRDRVNPDELLPAINELVAQRKLNDAVSYISTLDLHKHFNIPDIVATLVHQNKFPVAAQLVQHDVPFQKDLIKQMTTNKNSSKAADLIKQFKLDPNDFPDLIQRLQKNCLRYYQGQDTWMKVEEKFYDFDHILGFYVEDLLYKQEYDIALSIIKRHDLWTKGCITKPDSIQDLEPYFTNPPTKTYAYLPNVLFTTDDFAPAEEVLGEAPLGTYWNLRDCGIDIEKDIIWVDDCDAELFDVATKDILSSEAIGMDSEFRLSMTKFDSRGTALLQLANHKRIYLIDALKLSTKKKYNDFLQELFTNPKILKIGHTLSADLEILKYDQTEGTELVIRNHLDLPRVFKGLFPDLTQSSLAFICEKITKKPMSKYEQISNWNRRPLRKTQLHYAALDALILIKIYEEMKKALESIGEDITRFVDSSIGGVIVGKKNKQKRDDDEEEKEVEEIKEDDENPEADDVEEQGKPKIEQKKKPYRPKNKKDKEEKKLEQPKAKVEPKNKDKDVTQFYADEKYADFYSDTEKIKFLVDNMAMKLAKYLRNLGMDAEYLENKDHHQLAELAKAEKRVIVTKDTRYFSKKNGIPCIFLKSQKTSDQLNELIEFFKIRVNKNNLLSRCVKCNHEGLIVLDVEEAKKCLQWKLEDYHKYETFWQCEKCKQVYWEGGTFKRAQNRFKEFASSDEEVAAIDKDAQKTGALDTDELQNFEFSD